MLPISSASPASSFKDNPCKVCCHSSTAKSTTVKQLATWANTHKVYSCSPNKLWSRTRATIIKNVQYCCNSITICWMDCLWADTCTYRHATSSCGTTMYLSDKMGALPSTPTIWGRCCHPTARYIKSVICSTPLVHLNPTVSSPRLSNKELCNIIHCTLSTVETQLSHTSSARIILGSPISCLHCPMLVNWSTTSKLHTCSVSSTLILRLSTAVPMPKFVNK